MPDNPVDEQLSDKELKKRIRHEKEWASYSVDLSKSDLMDEYQKGLGLIGHLPLPDDLYVYLIGDNPRFAMLLKKEEGWDQEYPKVEKPAPTVDPVKDKLDEVENSLKSSREIITDINQWSQILLDNRHRIRPRVLWAMIADINNRTTD